MKKKKKSICKKCGEGKRCHYCGRYFDNRGYERTFSLRKDGSGPTHYICPSCAE